MSLKIVADGPLRFWRAKKAAMSEDIEQKYAANLAKADPLQKRQIQARMAEEFLRREKIKAHQPLPGTLW